MFDTLHSLALQLYDRATSTQPRPCLHPIPGTKPVTVEAVLLPPLLYYVALLFLPPPPPPAVELTTIKLLRTTLALAAGFLFFRLPLAYHVPQSIGLSYQLGLVGLYGGTRVLDAFFISALWFGHVPKRVAYEHHARPETPSGEYGDQGRERDWTDGGLKDPFSGSAVNRKRKASRSSSPPRFRSPRTESGSQQTNGKTNGLADPSAPKATSPDINTPKVISNGNTNKTRRESTTMQNASYFLSKTLAGPHPTAVTEHAITDTGYPNSFSDRAAWALELEMSMRGQGFTWTTADVRHTRKTWLPTLGNRVHSILIHVLPIQLGAWYIISTIYTKYLAGTLEQDDYNPFDLLPLSSPAYRLHRQGELFDTLSTPMQLLLTVALGAFLMSAFSFGHSLFAIMLHPLSPSPLSFFPPLYTSRIWSITTVRAFWSFGWHRLFARVFLVWGVWPGEWIERTLLGKSNDQPADVGKVIGAFTSSAFVHAFSVRCVMAGRWTDAAGEMRFFLLNGLAVVVEGLVIRLVRATRRKIGWKESMWYDAWLGRVWWMATVIWSGREFARGWVKSGLVREMAMR